MALTIEHFAGATRVVFGPASIDILRNDAPPTPSAAVAERVCALQEPIDTTSDLHIVVYGSTPFLAALRRLDLSRNLALRSLGVEVVYDTLDNSRVVDVWSGILPVLRSIPEATALERVSLTSPVSLASLRGGWSRFVLVAGLAQLLYSIDHCLVRVVDRAPLDHINILPPSGELFLSMDWVRTKTLFPALYDYGMLRY
ncbi:hypothetical protein PsYK624_086610 [Phanerochaete sordida]|uniref:Uncharacterized protein n=1 Tax=Phanerochaete sordida TaxID=48140 RepID=A0A9P3GD59_9APHY|nr:hypothetical protein PsYK624_086610 [Phanerochaete sordida]